MTTSFPQPIGMSASWDTELIKQAGEVTGTEARVIWHRHPDYGLSRWAPTVDLERDPRWGRNEEGYGEDSVLTGKMAGAYIECFQSEIDRYFIFIIADILLEEIRTAVDFLSARFENAVRQRNDRILVEINNVFQLLGELF